MKKSIYYISGIAFIAITVVMLSIVSCKKSETNVVPNAPSNEFLTTVLLECINTAAPYDTTTGVWRILPAWSNPDTSEAILNFKKNSTYKCNVYILDESNTAASHFATDTSFNINNINSATVNVTTEIRARQNYHLICFDMTGGTPNPLDSNITVVRTDYDTNSPALQVGLNDNITTKNTSDGGKMEVTLHHQPNVKNGTCGPGSDDFDVTYTVNIN